MIRNPISAFQNPITVHGMTITNSARYGISSDVKPIRRQRHRGEPHQTGHRDGNEPTEKQTAVASCCRSQGRRELAKPGVMSENV